MKDNDHNGDHDEPFYILLKIIIILGLQCCIFRTLNMILVTKNKGEHSCAHIIKYYNQIIIRIITVKKKNRMP
jgi:hypothetical protein